MKLSGVNKLIPGTQISDSLLKKNNSNYWHFTIGTASTQVAFYYPTFDFDSSGNIYVLGDNTHFFKLNVGERKLDFYKNITGASTGSAGIYDDLIYDRTNNRFFITGYSSISSTLRAMMIRVNSDGTFNAASRTQTLSSWSTVPSNQSCALDSSGNLYIPYYENGKGTGGNYYKAGYLKMAPATGFLAKSEIFQAGNFYDYDGKVRIDSSNNIYFINSTNYTSETQYATAVSKRDSALNQSWTPRRLYNSTNYNNIYYTDGDIDSSGNIFTTGYGANTNSGNQGIIFSKWTSAGSISWRRFFTLSGQNLQTDNQQQRKITTDSSGNIYFGFSNSSNSNVSYVARYDSAGSLSWVMEYSFGYDVRGHGTSGDDAAQIYGGAPTMRVFNDDLYILGISFCRTPFGTETLDIQISKLPTSKIIPGKYYLKRNNFLTIKDVTSSFTDADGSGIFSEQAYTAATHQSSTSPVTANDAVTMTFTDVTNSYECSFVPLAN